MKAEGFTREVVRGSAPLVALFVRYCETDAYPGRIELAAAQTLCNLTIAENIFPSVTQHPQQLFVLYYLASMHYATVHAAGL